MASDGAPAGWRDVFKTEIREVFKAKDDWTLAQVDKLPKIKQAKDRGWKQFKDTAKVRFECGRCDNVWTSVNGVVLFHYRLKETGEVKMWLFGQTCRYCKDEFGKDEFESPGWYREEKVKVMENLQKKIEEKFYTTGGGSKRLNRGQRSANMTSKHEAELCQACQKGICRQGTGGYCDLLGVTDTSQAEVESDNGMENQSDDYPDQDEESDDEESDDGMKNQSDDYDYPDQDEESQDEESDDGMENQSDDHDYPDQDEESQDEESDDGMENQSDDYDYPDQDEESDDGMENQPDDHDYPDQDEESDDGMENQPDDHDYPDQDEESQDEESGDGMENQSDDYPDQAEEADPDSNDESDDVPYNYSDPHEEMADDEMDDEDPDRERYWDDRDSYEDMYDDDPYWQRDGNLSESYDDSDDDRS